MRKPKSAFDNKFHYDVGRFRHYVSFMRDVITDDGYGGTNEYPVLEFQTRAGKENVSTYKQAQIADGFLNYNKFQYFIIRNRKAFTLDKTFHINFGPDRYTILEITEMDDPCTFLKILCGIAK